MLEIEEQRIVEADPYANQGEFILLGGGRSNMLEQMIGESVGRQGRMVVVTASSSEEEKRIANYTEAWGNLVGDLTFLQRSDFASHHDRVLYELALADWVHFVGGSQLLGLESVGPYFDLLRTRARTGLRFSGISAGEAIMSTWVPFDIDNTSDEFDPENDPRARTYPGAIVLEERANGNASLLLPGARMLPALPGATVLDMHYNLPGRFHRSELAIADDPRRIVIGVDEKCGLSIVRGGASLNALVEPTAPLDRAAHILFDPRYYVDRGGLAMPREGLMDIALLNGMGYTFDNLQSVGNITRLAA